MSSLIDKVFFSVKFQYKKEQASSFCLQSLTQITSKISKLKYLSFKEQI